MTTIKGNTSHEMAAMRIRGHSQNVVKFHAKHFTNGGSYFEIGVLTNSSESFLGSSETFPVPVWWKKARIGCLLRERTVLEKEVGTMKTWGVPPVRA